MCPVNEFPVRLIITFHRLVSVGSPTGGGAIVEHDTRGLRSRSNDSSPQPAPADVAHGTGVFK